jgi:ADP-ribose pyrophosphatase YjhB (NUDIX family)
MRAPRNAEGKAASRKHAHPPHGAFRFCPYCASELVDKPVGGRNRPACRSCGFIHYRNPVVGVAVVIQDGSRVLLGRRSGSYAGKWCIPCGYVEWDEDIRDAARREFLEETGLEVRICEVLAVQSNFHNPRLHTAGIWFRGEVIGGRMAAGDDLDAVFYFELDGIPDDLAFSTDRNVLDSLRQANGVVDEPEEAIEGA